MIYVGTSGYNYPEWRGSFYPADFPAKEMFGYYAARFRTVEINATFYRMPTPKNTAAWAEQAPEGFKYSLKAPRQITHIKRLKDCGDAVKFFCDSARGLGSHLALLLFQLPPNLKVDAERLATCLAHVPDDLPVAVEFRNDSWFVDDVYRVLEARHASLCIADFGDSSTPFRATSRRGYLRLRDEGYTPDDLDRWAEHVASHLDRWDDVFVYFKHEEAGKGPEFARIFLERLAERGLTPA